MKETIMNVSRDEDILYIEFGYKEYPLKIKNFIPYDKIPEETFIGEYRNLCASIAISTALDINVKDAQKLLNDESLVHHRTPTHELVVTNIIREFGYKRLSSSKYKDDQFIYCYDDIIKSCPDGFVLLNISDQISHIVYFKNGYFYDMLYSAKDISNINHILRTYLQYTVTAVYCKIAE